MIVKKRKIINILNVNNVILLPKTRFEFLSLYILSNFFYPYFTGMLHLFKKSNFFKRDSIRFNEIIWYTRGKGHVK